MFLFFMVYLFFTLGLYNLSSVHRVKEVAMNKQKICEKLTYKSSFT